MLQKNVKNDRITESKVFFTLFHRNMRQTLKTLSDSDFLLNLSGSKTRSVQKTKTFGRMRKL
ncbi:Uncharacterized protein dnm_013560 [Desulfonema magnum]|uniref:Uncharacterized protein n=1 Tax=Desulfonema magnum TaxID=45655 RepID=A0A975BH61_9BACT|nr:Uncharacterized protein dnm_013560 [Desulfonema magnum]